MSRAEKRLREVYTSSPVLPFDETSRFILMSDCHRGTGSGGDNFLPNQAVYLGALQYYYDNGFTYIELGDGDELWENRCLCSVIRTHSQVFSLLSKFYQENRMHMLYGNHDMVKRRPRYRKDKCESYYCDVERRERPLFPGLQIPEGLILENIETGQRLFLTHGHQGSLLNDTLWPLARFLVRYVWRPLEAVGFQAPDGGGRSRRLTENIEKELSGYAKEENRILVTGHTHRPIFPSPGDAPYFNDGSCVHPYCITGLEIEHNRIALVKWEVGTREDRTLHIRREILDGPVPLAAYVHA